MGSEPENRTSGRGLKQSQSFGLRLRNVLGLLYAITFSCSWLVGLYIKARRPMQPMPNLGLIYPISWTFGCPTCSAWYVTRLEYILAGPQMFLVEIAIGISCFATGYFASTRKISN
jgi:hypothetical protein